MRASILCAAALVLSACGSSTDTLPTRYNFAVIDGRNQASVAGSAQLAKPITSQLARDPNGQFASGLFNWLAPAVAYAQTLTVAGTPVANAIVCGRETLAGEPKVVPLCAFTLADGKAANSVESGTKAGTYNIVFTAQVPTQAPVKDSTTVTVAAGPAVGAGGGQCNTDQPGCYLVSVGDVLDLHITFNRAWDQYNNAVDITTKIPSYAVRGPCGQGQPNCWPAPVGLTPDGTGWSVTIDKQWAGQHVFLYVFLDGNVVLAWPLSVK
jgi:hypothetical protein